jgi:hypothetical protein
MAAAAYELAVALEWVAMPRESGSDPHGQVFAGIAAIAAAVVTVVLAVMHARSPVFALIPIAAAGWMVADFYAFDPYYLPTHRRFSDAGLISAWWVYAVVLAGVGVAAASRRTSVLAPLYVLVCLLTVLFMGAGH